MKPNLTFLAIILERRKFVAKKKNKTWLNMEVAALCSWPVFLQLELGALIRMERIINCSKNQSIFSSGLQCKTLKMKKNLTFQYDSNPRLTCKSMASPKQDQGGRFSFFPA